MRMYDCMHLILLLETGCAYTCVHTYIHTNTYRTDNFAPGIGCASIYVHT